MDGLLVHLLMTYYIEILEREFELELNMVASE